MIIKLPISKLTILLVLLLFNISPNVIGASDPIFIPNNGQWNNQFSFKSEFGNLTVFATETGFKYLLSEGVDHDEENHEHYEEELVSKHAFSLNFHSAKRLDFKGENKIAGIHNYFYGNDRSKWISKVPLYSGIKSLDIYDGIDINAYGLGGSFKYDFIVRPGSNHEQIQLSYSGLDMINFNKKSIILTTSIGKLVESIPVSYQIINGKKVIVKCEYIKTVNGFGFNFPDGYDEDFALIIDPVLVASTLTGTTGSNSNFGHGAAFDLAGNIYTHGISFNSAYPINEGSFQELFGGGSTDAVISKLTPDGTDLIYATFIGGSGNEYPISTIVNGNEEIYVFGITTSNNFPVDPNAYQTDFGGAEDIFITALSSDGSELVGSTYLGGSEVDGRNDAGFGYDNYRGEINLNLNGEMYLATCSRSVDFPTTSGSFQEEKMGSQDGVLLKMDGDLSELIWSTFIGSNATDMAYGLRIKDDQTVYVCGAIGYTEEVGTVGDGFVTTDGAFQTEFNGEDTYDGFISHFESDGSTIISSTLLGGENLDKNYFMDLDNQDNVWVYMQSQSDWTVTDGVWGTGFGNLCVHKLNQELTQLEVTTYLTTGSSGNGTPVAFMVDLCNNVYASSYGTSGSDFVASQDAIFSTGGFYIGVFTPEISDLEFGTYYTGNHVDGGTSRFDKQGIIYQGVCSGGSFNTTPDAWATGQTTGWDVGVFKIDFEIESVYAGASAAGYLTGCAPHTAVFQNFSDGISFEWEFGNGETSTSFEPSTVYTEPGDYIVRMIVFDPESCNLSDTAYIPITVYPEVDFFTDFSWEINCQTGELQITDESQGPADIEYEWNMGDGTFLSDTEPVHIYEIPGIYTVTLTLSSAACNQEMIEEQQIVYIPYIEADFSVSVLDICDSFLINVANFSDGGSDYTWSMGDGSIMTTSSSFEYFYESSGTYIIQLIIEDELSCNLSDTTLVEVIIDEPPVLNPEISISQTGFCEDLTYLATVEPNGFVETYTWQLNNEIVSNEPALITSVNSPGLYTVSVILTDPICQDEFISTVNFEFYENLGFELPSPFPLCYHDESIFLNATSSYSDATYTWNDNLSSNPILEVTEEGEYEVTVGYNGCIEVQKSNVNAILEFPLAFEASICENQSNTILFKDNIGIVEEVLWSNGQSGFVFEVFQSGYYSFEAIDLFGCYQIDSLLAIPRDDDPNLEIPNIFTPNGDGKNEVFQIQGDSLAFYKLDVMNRWGKKVFSTNEIYAPWDGTIVEESGQESSEASYFYILKYRDQCDLENQVLTGNIKIIR